MLGTPRANPSLASIAARVSRQHQAFLHDDRGAIIMLVVVMFVPLFVLAGLSVDLMRHETQRADLQNALDRGVLAAADLSQDVPDAATARTMISEYMSSRIDDSRSYTLLVDEPDTTAGRSITASADLDMETIFLRAMDTDSLSVATGAGASQAVGFTEIVLVLDVSASMTEASTAVSGNTKLDDLKTAAKDFVTTVLTADTQDRTLISIVPYSSQVNLPSWMAAEYNINSHHGYSNCIEYDSFDFSTTEISFEATLEQSQHFIEDVGFSYSRRLAFHPSIGLYWSYTENSRWVSAYGCPREANAITAYSNSVSELHGAIENLQGESWTASYMGVKWGAHLLDPGAGPLVDARIAAGLPSSFDGWPFSWNSTQAKKIMVLMSDGKNTRLHRMNDDAYDQLGPDVFNNINNYQGLFYCSDCLDVLYEYPRIDNASMTDANAVPLGDSKLYETCDAVKQGASTVVYTIGFELSSDPYAAAVLEECATSLSTHYLVEGVDISTAFANIASELKTLKLHL
ncbi:MAG: pilus assembly protein TadG-related protein [Pseudomonadota bacterium]